MADGAAQRLTIVRRTEVVLFPFGGGGFLALALVGCTAYLLALACESIHCCALLGIPYAIDPTGYERMLHAAVSLRGHPMVHSICPLLSLIAALHEGHLGGGI